MKQHYILPTLLFLSLSAAAQINKGATLVGGQLSYFGSKQEYIGQEQKQNSAYFEVSLGRAIRENRVLGFTLGYAHQRQYDVFQVFDVADINNNRFSVGGFYRMYARLAKDFHFFGQADAAFYSSKQTSHYKGANADVTDKVNGGQITFTPGLAYRVWKKLYLEASLPSLVGVRYEVGDRKSAVAQVQNSNGNQFSVFSNLSGNTPLSSLGIGFRLVL